MEFFLPPRPVAVEAAAAAVDDAAVLVADRVAGTVVDLDDIHEVGGETRHQAGGGNP